MELKPKVLEAINKQINRELFSAYLYMSMAADLTIKGLPGFTNWMRIQAQEEMMHADKFYNYVLERNSRVILQPIEAPQHEWKSLLDIFEASLEHEKTVTKMLENILELARNEKDYATEILLQWYITEQVEEESSVTKIIDDLKLAGDAKSPIFMLDRELGQRTLNTTEVQA